MFHSTVQSQLQPCLFLSQPFCHLRVLCDHLRFMYLRHTQVRLLYFFFSRFQFKHLCHLLNQICSAALFRRYLLLVQAFLELLTSWFQTWCTLHLLLRTVKNFRIVSSLVNLHCAVYVVCNDLVHIQSFIELLLKSMLRGARKKIVRGVILPFVLFLLSTTCNSLQGSIEKHKCSHSNAVCFAAFDTTQFILA